MGREESVRKSVNMMQVFRAIHTVWFVLYTNFRRYISTLLNPFFFTHKTLIFFFIIIQNLTIFTQKKRNKLAKSVALCKSLKTKFKWWIVLFFPGYCRITKGKVYSIVQFSLHHHFYNNESYTNSRPSFIMQ